MTMSEHHRFVDPGATDTPRQREARKKARRAYDDDIAERFALGDGPSRPASAETRRKAMEQFRNEQEAKKAINNIPEVSVSLAARANALLGIKEYIDIRNRKEAVEQRPLSGPNKTFLVRLEDTLNRLQPFYDEGLDAIFPEGTDPDRSQRAELEQRLGAHGKEARAERADLETRLRGQAAVMGFRVSSAPDTGKRKTA